MYSDCMSPMLQAGTGFASICLCVSVRTKLENYWSEMAVIWYEYVPSISDQ